MLNVVILVEHPHVLVYRLILVVLPTADQNAPSVPTVLAILLAFAKNAQIPVQDLVGWEPNAALLTTYQSVHARKGLQEIPLLLARKAHHYVSTSTWGNVNGTIN